MAQSTPAAPTPGALYFNLTPALRAFYAARGMWAADGTPRGALAGMLGPRTPWESPNGIGFWVTPTQIGLLMRDLMDNGSRGLSNHQYGQSMRRLREALGIRPPRGAAPRTPRAAAPFEPLVAPPPAGARRRAAFEKHVWDCLRDFVDFTQSSAYTGGQQ